MVYPEPAADDDHWSLESLNKAYQQGYMVGMTGQSQTLLPYSEAVPAAAWEAGWDDGHEQFELRRPQKSA